MKKRSKILSVLASGLIILLINGCQKSSQGPAGPAGSNGNANVSSTLFNVTSWGWSSPYYYVNLNVSALTSANLNSSGVMVYFKTTGNVWSALPYTQYNSPYDYYMGFNTSAGNVQVTWVYDTSLSNGSDPNTYYGANVQCKVVVIPPSIKKANPDLDLRNYEMVKKRFNLAD